MPDSQAYLHFQWTMPGGIPGGPTDPLTFSIVSAEMKLRDAPPYVAGLKGVLQDQTVSTLKQAVDQLLTTLRRDPEQPHVFVFISAPTEHKDWLEAGARIISEQLKQRWAGKSVSMVAILWKLFNLIEQIASCHGFHPTPPPSEN